MTLIDTTGTPLEDRWHYPNDDGEAARSPHSIVPLAEWAAYRRESGTPAAGVWVTGEQDAAELLPLLDQIQVLVIEFPKSRDGRGFTLARVLRERHHYSGDIRAAGPLLPDQFSMLIQCGYTSLLAPPTVPLSRWRDAAAALAQATARPRTLLDRLSRNRQA